MSKARMPLLLHQEVIQAKDKNIQIFKKVSYRWKKTTEIIQISPTNENLQ